MIVKLNGNKFFEVTSKFGEVSKIHPTGHTGIDLAMNEGTKIFSPTDGVVEKIVDYGNENIGKGIIIENNNGEDIILGHLSDTSFVKEGQIVKEGDLLALSGNTGNSTGSHLHLGMTDQNGNFINPEKLISESNHEFIRDIDIGNVSQIASADGGTVEGIKSFWDFISRWYETGSFWEAIYGKPFFEVMKDFFKELFHDLFKWMLSNGDLFFLMPAIFLMFVTFFIGRNKYTKFILPLWFAYALSIVLYRIIP